MTKCLKNYETEDVEFEKNMPLLLNQEKYCGSQNELETNTCLNKYKQYFTTSIL